VAASAVRIAEILSGLRARSACLSAAADVPASARLSTGLPRIDEPLGGGLPRGRLVELIGPRSSGRMSTTFSCIEAAQRAGELAALVDAVDGFDPRSAIAAGIDLERLLWVRPGRPQDGLRAADLVLDAGGFGLVVLYACPSAGLQASGKMSAWARLAKRAERAKSAFLVVLDRPLASTFGAATLELDRGRARWLGSPDGPRRLEGVSSRVVIARSKIGAPSGEAPLELSA
jgi:RecA/RadA recombinase